MHDPTPLLEAILEQPGEDPPRLVYADWLEEYGDGHDRALAEFIRVGCAFVRTPAADLARRQQELLNAHGPAWLGPVTDGDVAPSWFRRGLAVLPLSLARYLRRQEEVRRCRAVLGVVCVVRDFGRMPQSVHEHGGSARRVGLALDLSPLGKHLWLPALQELGEDDRLLGVGRLVLRRCGLIQYEQLFETLAQSPYLSQVTEVDLGSTPGRLVELDDVAPFNHDLVEPLTSPPAVAFCRGLRKVVLSWDADALHGDERHERLFDLWRRTFPQARLFLNDHWFGTGNEDGILRLPPQGWPRRVGVGAERFLAECDELPPSLE
jgi:uncharacterized protein (TIGR02996 family)